MIDNVDIAILTKVNELAERRGIQPYDFIATIQRNEERGYSVVFEVPAVGAREKQFEKMLDDLGADEGQLTGSLETIVAALDRALRQSPRVSLRP